MKSYLINIDHYMESFNVMDIVEEYSKTYDKKYSELFMEYDQKLKDLQYINNCRFKDRQKLNNTKWLISPKLL